MNTTSTRTDTKLGPRFRGRPASTSARLAAVTIDTTLFAGTLLVVYLLTNSGTWVLVTALDLLGLAWIWQSRAGLSPAHAILGLRTSRQDLPWSPGAGRAMARSIINGLGFLTGGIGAWVIASTSAFDPSGQGRTWADRAGGTIVVKAPAREPAPQRQIPAVAPNLGIVEAAQPTQLRAVPHPTGTTPIPTGMNPFPAGVTPLPTGPSPLPAGVTPLPTVPTETSPQPVVPPVSPAAPFGASGALMLAFDTGQREYVAGGSVAVLGRSPSAVEPTDSCVAVADPDGTVSKNHLRIEHARDGVWLTDLGSTNGTVVIDDIAPTAPLPPHTRTLLADGERVRIGQRVFTVSLMVAEN